jgi:putative SOS response-associated peptidase YedK
MCGRFEQSETREYYVRALGVDTRGAEWVGGDTIPQYNLSPGRSPLVLHLLKGTLRPTTSPGGIVLHRKLRRRKSLGSMRELRRH